MPPRTIMPDRTELRTYVDEPVKRALDQLADDKGISTSRLVRDVLTSDPAVQEVLQWYKGLIDASNKGE